MPAPPRFLIGVKPRRAGAGSRLAKPSRSDAEGGLDAALARRTIEAGEAEGCNAFACQSLGPRRKTSPAQTAHGASAGPGLAAAAADQVWPPPFLALHCPAPA